MGRRILASQAFRVVASVAILLAALIGAFAWVDNSLFDRPHTEFLGNIDLGMTEGQIEAAVGKPAETWDYANRERMTSAWISPDPGTHGHLYYHTWQAQGQWPSRFDHVALYQPLGKWGVFIFYDGVDKVICIVSGAT